MLIKHNATLIAAMLNAVQQEGAETGAAPIPPSPEMHDLHKELTENRGDVQAGGLETKADKAILTPEAIAEQARKEVGGLGKEIADTMIVETVEGAARARSKLLEAVQKHAANAAHVAVILDDYAARLKEIGQTDGTVRTAKSQAKSAFSAWNTANEDNRKRILEFKGINTDFFMLCRAVRDNPKGEPVAVKRGGNTGRGEISKVTDARQESIIDAVKVMNPGQLLRTSAAAIQHMHSGPAGDFVLMSQMVNVILPLLCSSKDKGISEYFGTVQTRATAILAAMREQSAVTAKAASDAAKTAIATAAAAQAMPATAAPVAQEQQPSQQEERKAA